MALEKEIEFYKTVKASLLATHGGSFVLIKGQNIEGFFPSYEEALQKALEKFGVEEVLIKQVLDPEPEAFFLNGLVR